MSATVVVHIECPCPGKPHDAGDEVYLRAKLGLAGGVALQSQFSSYLKEAVAAKHLPDWNRITGMMAEGYLLNGVESWTLVDERGIPVPISDDTIRERLLDDFEVARLVGDKADDLYYEPVLAPLLKSLSDSLETSLTSALTSATKSSRVKTARRRSPSTRRSSKRPTPLKRSSTSTTRTASTGTTLAALDGASTG